MPPKTRGAVRKPRRKDKKNIALGQAHIKSTFNNTIVSITDPTGAVISWASAGEVGMKVRASRPRTPHRWPPSRLPSVPRSTACARLTFSSRPGLGTRNRDPLAAGRRP